MDVNTWNLVNEEYRKSKEDVQSNEAIEFANWLGDYENPFQKLESGRWCQACGNSTTWTTAELYKLFSHNEQK